MKLSIVAPVYNEEETLRPLAEKIADVCEREGYDFEVLFVDDGSTDLTFEVLRELCEEYPWIKVVRFQRNFGQSAAMSAGFDHASGDVIVTIDADLQNDPEDIPLLLEKIDQGFDIVSGWRKGRMDNKALRILPSMAANGLIRWITGVKLHDIGCTLKAYRRPIVENISLYGDLHRFLPVLGHRVGAKIAEIPVRHHPRRHGVSKYGMGRILRVAFDLFTIKFLMSFSTRPMHFFGYISLFLFTAAAAAGGFAVYMKWFTERRQDLSDNPLLYLTVLLIIVGVQFLATGLLAEINLRTYHESEGRTPYIVGSKINLPEDSRGC